jgi:hypothetical protein
MKGGHRRGAGGFKTEAKGEKIGWVLVLRATCREMRGRGSGGARLGEACGHQEARACVCGGGRHRHVDYGG